MGNTDIFEKLAKSYDTSERNHIATISADAIRELLVDSKNKSAVDFGCGTGLVGMNLIQDFGSILFVDSSQNMIDRLTHKLEQRKQGFEDFNIQKVDTLCLDLEKGEKLTCKADYIFMSQVLLHIKDIRPVLTGLYDILTIGGHLFIIDFDKNEEIVSDLVHNGFKQEELRDLMDQIGYRQIRSKTFYHGSKIFMNQDASLFILDAQK